MSNSPLVSIALCVYNGEKYLEQQLQTLVNQTYSNLEIIIVDDVSTDQSVSIVRKFLTDQRIKLFINDKNLGYVKNFEKAINYCKGAFIALADQDDLWDLDKINILTKNIRDAILIYHDSELIDSDGKSMKNLSSLFNMYAGNSPIPFLFYNCVSGHSCMFKRDLVAKLGPFNPKFHHDWWIAFVAAHQGEIVHIDLPLVKYRQHQLSNTDILNIKPKDKQIPKFAEMNLPWLKNCQTVNGKHQQLIKRIIYLYEHRSIANAFKLLTLLCRRYQELYFVKKKSNLSKLNYIRKMVFYNRSQYNTLQ